MRSKHRKTLAAIFENPVKADIRWSDIEALFRALGADVIEGKGSRVRVALYGVRGIFHRPHPRPEANKSMVRSIRNFLTQVGVRS